MDPIGLEGGENVYEYALSEPLAKIDRLGKQPLRLENQYQGETHEASIAGSLSRAGLGGSRVSSQIDLDFSIRTEVGGAMRTYRIRADFLVRIGSPEGNRFVLLEAKASQTASFTDSQRIVYREIQYAMERGETVEARVATQSGRAASRISRLRLSSGESIRIEGVQIVDPSNRGAVIRNVRAATRGLPGWRVASSETLRRSMQVRRYALARGRYGGYTRLSSPIVNPALTTLAAPLEAFVNAGLRLDPEERIRNCDVFRCTRIDYQSAIMQRHVRERAQREGVTEGEILEQIRRRDSRITRRIGPRDPNEVTISPGFPQSQEQSRSPEISWRLALQLGFRAFVLGDREAFDRVMGLGRWRSAP